MEEEAERAWPHRHSVQSQCPPHWDSQEWSQRAAPPLLSGYFSPAPVSSGLTCPLTAPHRTVHTVCVPSSRHLLAPLDSLLTLSVPQFPPAALPRGHVVRIARVDRRVFRVAPPIWAAAVTTIISTPGAPPPRTPTPQPRLSPWAPGLCLIGSYRVPQWGAADHGEEGAGPGGAGEDPG